jgi:WD40 repeat protein
LRWGATGLTVVLFAVAGLLGLVWKKSKQLERAQLDSHQRELAAYSKDNSDYDPDLSILLAIEAARITENTGISMTSDAIEALKKALAAEQTKFLLAGHTAPLRGADFSPDGKYVATSSFDKTARVWDVATGKPVSVLAEHQDAVMNVAFSPDGQFIATACADKKVRVWVDWQTNAPRVIAVREEPDKVFSATFSPDGRHLLVTSVGFIYGWEWRAGESSPQRQWAIPEDKKNNKIEVWHAVFSPDGNYFVAGTRVLSPKISSFRVAFSNDGKYIAGRCGDNITCVWDWKNPDAQNNPVELSKSMIGVQGVAFSPDDQIVSNGLRDGTVLLWNWRNATEKYSGKPQQLLGHVGENSTIFSLAFSPDGQFLVSTSQDKTARIWVLKERESKEELDKMTPPQLLKLAESRRVRDFTEEERQRYIEEAQRR